MKIGGKLVFAMLLTSLVMPAFAGDAMTQVKEITKSIKAWTTKEIGIQHLNSSDITGRFVPWFIDINRTNMANLDTERTFTLLIQFINHDYFYICALIFIIILYYVRSLFKGRDWTGCKDEACFDKKMVMPLLTNLGFKHKYQDDHNIQVGRNIHSFIVDFYVYDHKGPITIFEDKLSIRTEGELEAARRQAKSYAILLRMNSFIVASQENLWIYKLNASKPALSNDNDLLTDIEDILIRQISPDKLNWWTLRGLKKQILKMRP